MKSPSIRTIASALGRGEASIWTLSLAMLAGAAAILTLGGAGALHPGPAAMRLPLWSLLLGFAAAEQLVVHVHFRRSAHSMSLGEIPLVFALLYTGGWTVVLAYTAGRGIVLALVRRLPPIRLAFNLGEFALGGTLALITFHAISGHGSTVDPRLWLAAAVATTVASAFAMLMISVVVSISEGRLSLDRIVSSLQTDMTVTLANTSIGLCAARLVEHDWRTAVLLVVPVLGMFLTMRAYAAERERHGRLEFLYDAARALSGSAETGEALETMLARSLEAFRTEVAEIIFFSPSGDEALRTAVDSERHATLLEPLGPQMAMRLRDAMGTSTAACHIHELTDPWLSEYLRSRGLADGLFTVLRGEHACIGAIAIGDPSGVVDASNADDIKLFETLAANTTVALENDQLGQTVWQLRMLQSELEHQASHDPLTGLANRSLFSERLDEALARGTDEAAVIFIDVNDFKMVNDTLGHAAGDELLVAIAGRLGDCVRPSDTLARLGGDEFAILLAGRPSQAQAVEIAERIDTRMDSRFSIAGQLHGVRVSIGIALGESGAMTSEQLLRNADLAMYRAKQAKTSRRYELFESGMEVPVLHSHGLRRRLRDATRHDSFAVHYQPIVDLTTGATTAREALVRWVDGPRGVIEPKAFIPVAEEMGVIVPIGRRVLTRACEEAQSWGGEGAARQLVHVNLSPVELRDEGFLDGVHTALDRSGLDPQRLVLEITEGVVLGDLERCLAIFNELHRLGVQLALDDFGTGYSSLSQLRGLPLQWLKLGRPFVDDLEPEGTSRPFVRMIVALAESLGVRVVAEEIETRRQLQLLRALGCGFGQGFYLGAPAAGQDTVAPVVATPTA